MQQVAIPLLFLLPYCQGRLSLLLLLNINVHPFILLLTHLYYFYCFTPLFHLHACTLLQQYFLPVSLTQEAPSPSSPINSASLTPTIPLHPCCPLPEALSWALSLLHVKKRKEHSSMAAPFSSLPPSISCPSWCNALIETNLCAAGRLSP